MVVKIWDERRLVVPVGKFLDEPFENWTRTTSQITGTVYWHLDPATDVARLRNRLDELVTNDPRWDGRLCNLKVTGTTADSIEVRALVTARDASDAFDLRCAVREGMLAFIAAEMPEAMVRTRNRIELPGDEGERTQNQSTARSFDRQDAAAPDG